MIDPARICLGTMRMTTEQRDVAGWAAFLAEAYAMGVRTLHVSTEYDSWALTCAVVQSLRRTAPHVRFRFIAKLGEPHFDQPRFEAGRFEAAVDAYCSDLHIDCLDDVQWMWRADLKDDAARCAHFASQADDIGAAVAALRQAGKIGRMLCFPYSVAFADRATALAAFDGLVVYRNADEREYDASLDCAHRAGKMAHIIRPFFAGATLSAGGPTPREQLVAALDHPAVETAILSTGRLDHLQSLIG